MITTSPTWQYNTLYVDYLHIELTYFNLTTVKLNLSTIYLYVYYYEMDTTYHIVF